MFRFSSGKSSGSSKSAVPLNSLLQPKSESKVEADAKRFVQQISELTKPTGMAAMIPTNEDTEEMIRSHVRAGLSNVTVPEIASEKVIDVAEIPAGTYQCFTKLSKPVPAHFASSFALINKDGEWIVLAAELSTHSFFEFINRLQTNNIKAKTQILTTHEIIKSLHDQNRAQDKSFGPETDAEASAWALIEDAANAETSDIHIETRGAHANVFFRIHGERIAQSTLATETAIAICSILCTVHADDNSKGKPWTNTEIHGSSIERTLQSGARIQLRFSSGPIHPAGNFHAVIRILRMDSVAAKSLEQVGYEPEQREQIEEMLIGSTGLVLLVGPPNSGKSTSLQSFIQRIYKRRGSNTKIITVEDPVEYLIPQACQMGVPSGRKALEDKNGSIFNTFLQATLRQDPDVLMVGEIRNDDTAEAVKNFVLAGRKILSTIHAYESFAIFPRLRELGVPESILTSKGFISGVIYQRLVPTLCEHCAIPIDTARANGLIPDDLFHRVSQVADFGEDSVRVRNHEGCPECDNKGITGRVPCAELLVPDDRMLMLLRQGDDIGAKAHWKQKGAEAMDGLGVTALSHAIYLMRRGKVDPHDIEIQIGKIANPRF